MQRREFLKGLGAASVAAALGPGLAGAAGAQLTKRIPGTDESIPVIGMGSWITFDVPVNSPEVESRLAVLQEFFDRGGAVIDSSPMYGASQAVIGHCLDRIENDVGLYAATKVWTPGKDRGIHQMDASRELWGVPRFDLMQVHNMVQWRTHLETLLEWKEQGKIRHIGITTSHGGRHRRMLEVIEQVDGFDFVQFSYNILDRTAENRLLPAALDNGKAVMINRPFMTGNLFRRLGRKPFPRWAGEIDCDNWAQFFLKFVVSHPAVTCAIPATRQVGHMRENMGACYGRLPDKRERQRMIDYVTSV